MKSLFTSIAMIMMLNSFCHFTAKESEHRYIQADPTPSNGKRKQASKMERKVHRLKTLASGNL